MNKQKKAWETRRKNLSSDFINNSLCIVCKKRPTSSNTSKTCCKVCSAKLAWITGKKNE